MPGCTPAPTAAPAGLASLAGAALAGPGTWDASSGWDSSPAFDAIPTWDAIPAWDVIPSSWDAIPPTDEELWCLASDLEGGPPDSDDPWAVGAGADLSMLPRDADPGAGFAVSGAADGLPPGVTLAGLASGAWAARLDRLTDDQLIGVLRAWRRLTSWTAAGELAAVAELDRRRADEVAAGADPHLAEHVGDELAVALTLTTRGADQLLDFAVRLERLPCTRAALAAGEIDRARAYVLADEVSCLDHVHAAAVEAAVIGRAPGQTTGQLRASARRAALAADPEAASRQREKAEKEARVEVWFEPSGTAALAGRDLRPSDVIEADKRIDALARQLKAAGIEGGLDQLRARAYVALLLGQPLPSPCLSTATGSATGSVNLTMPLASWLGASEEPGDVAGFGPIAAAESRALADRLAGERASRWCLTLTGQDGQAVAHGCLTLRPLAVGDCLHQRESAGYQPSPGLRHVIMVRQRTCSFPGCRRPASRCDQDHTVPYDQGGRTCECNLAPLCRQHHRCKQAERWCLEQPEPGVLVWRTPSGRTYTVTPTVYPV